jgi:hypothetical protein
MTRRLLYLGPDPSPADLSSLPPGEGAALGSDYCVHLLPSPERLARLCEAAAEGGTPLLLLVPWLRDDELRRLLPLLRAVPAGAPLAVSANDFGLLLTMKLVFPELPRTLGRLLSGQKRCPRTALSPLLTAAGRAWHGEGVPGSAAARSLLSAGLDLSGYHADLLGGSALAGWAAALAAEGCTLYVHLPPAAVTVTDRCPWLGGRTSASLSACPRHCRSGVVTLSHPSMGGDLLLRGKGRFTDPFAGDAEPPVPPEGENVVLVRYDGVP